MRILAFIEDEEVIEKVLNHLGLWDLKVRPPPKEKAPSVTISIDDSDSQVPFSALLPILPPITRWTPTGFQTRAWAVRGSEYLPYSFCFHTIPNVSV